MSNEAGDIVIGVTLTLIVMIIVMGMVIDYKQNSMQDEAVKAKVAEYYLDENNEKQFRYKESK